MLIITPFTRLPNGLHYLHMSGRDNAWEQKNLEARKMPQNPTRQVYALWAFLILTCIYPAGFGK